MMSLLALPVELRQKIYKLVKDRETLKRLSACSRTLRHDLAPLLWGYMHASWILKNDARKRNLVYTKEIVFDFDFDGSQNEENEDNDVLCENFKECIKHCGASLKRMHIWHYNLDGSGKNFSELKKLPNLEELIFYKFQRSGRNPLLLTTQNMEVLSHLPSLKVLEVSDEKFDPRAFKALCSGSLVSLKVLNLTKSRLTDPGLTLLKNLRSLEVLKLAEASITVVGFKRINGLLQLKSLDLFKCRRIKDIPVLDALPSLEKLCLMSTSITDHSLINLKALPNLKRLCITYCKNITLRGFEHLFALTTLEVLRCDKMLSPEETDTVKRKMAKCLVQDDFRKRGYDYKNDPWYK